MKLTIHKHPLQVGTKVSITMPKGSKILKAGCQGTTVCIWVEKPLYVAEHEVRHFNVYGTGWDIDEGCDVVYVDTVFQKEFVWHVYELLQP